MGGMGKRGGTNVDFDLACRSGWQSLTVSRSLPQSHSLTHLVPGASLGLRHGILAHAVVRLFADLWGSYQSQVGESEQPGGPLDFGFGKAATVCLPVPTGAPYWDPRFRMVGGKGS